MNRKMATCVFGLILIFALIPLASFGSKVNPHGGEVECSNCHVEIPDAGELSRDSAFVRDIDDLCRDCHQFQHETTHPTGMMPYVKIPDDFPLDRSGRMTCATCHVIHPANEYTAFPHNLRRPATGEAFCNECHSQSLGYDQVLEHKLGMGIAHFESKPSDSVLNEPMDAVSFKCLSCHDGSIGRFKDVNLNKSGERKNGSPINVSHPIGIDYSHTAAQNNELVPVGSLDSCIQLFEGKVGCGSCHNIYSKRPVYLSVDNMGSALCLECHRK